MCSKGGKKSVTYPEHVLPAERRSCQTHLQSDYLQHPHSPGFFICIHREGQRRVLVLSNEARAGEQKSVPSAPFYLPSFHLPACSNDNAHRDLHLSAGAGEVLRAQGGEGGSLFQKTPEIKLPWTGEPRSETQIWRVRRRGTIHLWALRIQLQGKSSAKDECGSQRSSQSHVAGSGSWAPGCSSKAATPPEGSTSSRSPCVRLPAAFTPSPPTLCRDFLNPLMLLCSNVFPDYFPLRWISHVTALQAML